MRLVKKKIILRHCIISSKLIISRARARARLPHLNIAHRQSTVKKHSYNFYDRGRARQLGIYTRALKCDFVIKKIFRRVYTYNTRECIYYLSRRRRERERERERLFVELSLPRYPFKTRIARKRERVQLKITILTRVHAWTSSNYSF